MGGVPNLNVSVILGTHLSQDSCLVALSVVPLGLQLDPTRVATGVTERCLVTWAVSDLQQPSPGLTQAY